MQKSALDAEDAGHRAALLLCKKIHAPIRRLSLDVLSEIAWHCIPIEPIGPPSSWGGQERSKKVKRFPFVFTHVCSAWRTAALSTPSIWTTLHLAINEMDSSTSMGKLTQIVKKWFKRARQLPLSLYMHIDDSGYNFRTFMMFHVHGDGTQLESPLGCFLTSLSPFMPRFKKLSLISRQRDCLFQILKLPVTWDLRNLESLYIQSTTHRKFSDEDAPNQNQNRLFRATPALTHLNLDCMVAKRVNLKYSLPWSQLTHLDIPSRISVPDWVAVMDLCTSLKTAMFTLADFAPANFPLHRSSSAHDNLEGLSLKLPRDEPFNYSPLELLQAFRLPNLKYLDTSRGLSRDEGSSTEAPHSDMRTLTSLERLSFFDNRYDCLPRLLKETPNLYELSTATYGPFPAALLTAMTYTPHSDFSPNINILPHLDIFNLALENRIETPNLVILKTMLLSRTNNTIPMGCRPLKEVTIVMCDKDGIDDLKTVVEECNEVSGVNIVLKPSERLWYKPIPTYVSM